MAEKESRDNQKRRSIAAPAVSLPTGGGAIKGLGEKFAANPVNGTGSIAVPIAISPGRSGFAPQLTLSYDSAAGNGPFGFGWSLGLPQISRKTDNALPRYDDAAESDVFILSGVEDLVPLLVEQNGAWSREAIADRTIGADTFSIRRYRPRIEGAFARIERWTRLRDGEVHWRSISPDNHLTLYGSTADSRVADPADPRRVFTWLICESRDDKGNAVVYEYKHEDGAGADFSRAHQRNRGGQGDVARSAQRYIKRIRYGNRRTLLDDAGQRPPLLTTVQLQSSGWMFDVVFDYGEHSLAVPTPDDAGEWTHREDAFSSYRSGFEIRTNRVCRRVLMFHHFPGAPNVGNDCLVCSTDFEYTVGVDADNGRGAGYTFLRAITESSYARTAGGYRQRHRPPIAFAYSQPIVQDAVAELDDESLANLPIGIDGAVYQWIDLHGEGIPGILTEQGAGWFFKRNVSPISDRAVEFAPAERVALKPNHALAGGAAHFMDLAGDGQPDLVVFDDAVPGLYEHDAAEGWDRFRPFTERLNLDFRDPNLKLVDLDGDGHADVLITEDDALVWHRSRGEEGFGPAERMCQAIDEEKGPRLVFADGTESIYLADLNGDGLTDLVRIRNGEVCYWPNLGYARFGARVTMDGSPQFDDADQFDQKRVRLADIDGSGTADILYLHRDGVRLYFNQSGNGWSEPRQLRAFARVDDLVSIVPLDLFGNGTACLVWSSSLPGDAGRPVRYVDLMGGQKPHLLIRSANNLGADTQISYAPSTRFYLADRAAGRPWITRLPFPVHCVEKITVTDKWRGTRFSTTYSYHHGCFDGAEREFRGFARVEQVDVESYGGFMRGNTASPYVTDDKTLYQPPVKTVTWFDTGAAIDGRQALVDEHFPRAVAAMPAAVGSIDNFHEQVLGESEFPPGLDVDEWREACRARKGVMLRQEVYELDVDALEQGRHRAVKLFSTVQRNCRVQRVQAKAGNRHAVFLADESEAVTCHYELDLRQGALRPDPRVSHSINLRFDEQGNVLQSIAAVYPRRIDFEEDGLPAHVVEQIRSVQSKRHLAYTETRYTNDVTGDDSHRLRAACEVLSYELTGIQPAAGLFTADELGRLRLSQVHQSSGEAVEEIAYHQHSDGAVAGKRLVEHSRTLFLRDDAAALDAPLPLGQIGATGLLFETYTLALSEELLAVVFGGKLTPGIRLKLDDPAVSGYLSGASLAARFPAGDPAGQHWIRSGIAGFSADAAQHFYLPERYIDAFGSVTTVAFDPLDLFITSSTDALGNTTRVERFDYRVLAPAELRDINGNLSEVYFDLLGAPCAQAVKGKGSEGDSLAGFDIDLANPALNDVAAFFDRTDFDEARAREWLGGASVRQVWSFGEIVNTNGSVQWAAHPACTCRIVRETHSSQLQPAEHSALQATFAYSDGTGGLIATKTQAEPESPNQPIRWAVTGKTIFNNKGQAVKQYEPYFTASPRFEEPLETGVTAVIYYDAVGRVMRTEYPDGTLSRVEFSPWLVRSFDPNDTVLESSWYADRNPPAPGGVLPRDATGRLLVSQDQRAAWLTAPHAGTPSLTVLDSLGRDVIAIAHNLVKDANGPHLFGGERWRDERLVTFTKLDAEGKALWIRDARGNLVMQYITPHVASDRADDPMPGFSPAYDIAGNLLYQHATDAGDRWMLNDAAGNPLFAWNNRGHIFHTEYDALRRPVGSTVIGADATDPGRAVTFNKVIYGDTPGNGLTETQKSALNLRGKPYKLHDTAGLVVNMAVNPATGVDEAFDFKGNLLRTARQLLADYRTTPDWSANPSLESERFESASRFDALNRPVQMIAAHSNRPDAMVNVIRPRYNEASLLDRVDVWLDRGSEPTATLDPAGATNHLVADINYDAKGRRTKIVYGNGASTACEYDPLTFRMTRLLTDRAGVVPDWPHPPDPPRGGIQNLSYVYDPAGNIVHIQDDAQHTIFFSGERVDASSDYQYDALYRLVSATGREHIGQHASPQINDDDSPRMRQPLPTDGSAMRNYTETYDYDGVGNILRMIHEAGANGSWTRRYDYESANNRLRATSLPGDADAVFSAKYHYDVHGNMTRMPHLSVMRWDFRDQLHASARQVVTSGTPETTWYVYDGSGRRVRKVTDRQAGAGETPRRMKERVYLGDCEIYREYDGTAAPAFERESLHVMDGVQRVVSIETGTIDVSSPAGLRTPLLRYQFHNHLGSASLELDEAAQIISYEEFHPYGSTSYQAVRSHTEASKRYRYTGMERDDENGLSYHAARYYAPWLARWVSPDPAELQDGLNLYAYARQNPLLLVDPNGTESQKAPNAAVEKVVNEVKTYYNRMLDVAEDSLQSTKKHWRDPMKVGKLAGDLIREDLNKILGKGNFEVKIRGGIIDISLKDVPLDIELKKSAAAKRTKQSIALERHAKERGRVLVYVMGDTPAEFDAQGQVTKASQTTPPTYVDHTKKGLTSKQISRLEKMTAGIRAKVASLAGRGVMRRGVSLPSVTKPGAITSVKPTVPPTGGKTGVPAAKSGRGLGRMLRGAAAISKLNMAFGASGLYSDILQGFAREDPDLLPYDKPIVLKKYFDPNDASSLFIYRPSGYTVEKTGTGIIYRNSDGDPVSKEEAMRSLRSDGMTEDCTWVDGHCII